MNLQKLKYFYSAAKFLSVTESARANHVTQSAVSQAIRGLESDLNSKLIKHGKNSFELTTHGHIVFEECETIFNTIENLKANLTRGDEELRGVLRVATTNSIAITILASALKTISKKYPHLTLQLKLGNSDQVKGYLKSQEADIGFILEDDEMNELKSTFILTGSFRLVGTPKSVLNTHLKNIIITRRDKVEIKHLRRRLGKDVQFQMEVFSWLLIRKLCLQGAGIGYLPDYLVETDIRKNLLKVCQPALETYKYKLMAIQREQRVLSASGQRFLDIVVAQNS